MPLTTTDAAAYLEEIGLELPATLLAAVVAKLDDLDACMDANGYSENDKTMVRYHLVGLLAIATGARRVASQSSPSGASRSYDNASLIDLHRTLVAGLRVFDPNGCATSLVPAEPGPAAALYVVSGRR